MTAVTMTVTLTWLPQALRLPWVAGGTARSRTGCRIRLPCGIGPRDHYDGWAERAAKACRALGLLAHGQLVPIPARLEG